MSEKIGNGKVSIVLPVYNGELNVDKSISSVLTQTYSNLELIIVNDCSTDNTIDVLKKYAEQDSRITIINNLVNLKLPRSLNVGFEQATGEYFTWTSDDNLYKENAIERMVNALQTFPDFDMVYANYTNIDAEGQIIGEDQLEEPEHLLMGNVVGACFLYTKEIAREVGEYDINLFLAEDYDYWIRILRAGKILHINENLYYYRRHAGSLSQTKRKWVHMQTYKALEKNFMFLFSFAKTKRQRYALYDQILYRSEEEKREEVCKMLYRIDRGYLRLGSRRKIRRKIQNSFLGIKLCALKKNQIRGRRKYE